MVNLLCLLVDSDLTINPATEQKFTTDTVRRFARKLKLDKTEKQAEEHFDQVFQDATNAVLTLIQDDLHWFKVKWLNPITNCCKKMCR